MKYVCVVFALTTLASCSTPRHDGGSRDWRASSDDLSDYIDAPLQSSATTREVTPATRAEAVALLADVSFRSISAEQAQHFGATQRGPTYLLRAFRFTDRVYGLGVYRRGSTVRTRAGAMGAGPMRVERTAVIYYDTRRITRAFADYGLTQ